MAMEFLNCVERFIRANITMANKSLRVYLKAYFVVYNQLNSKINLTL